MKELKMNYRKTFLGALIAFGAFASQMVLASQVPMGPQSGPAQTASPSASHQGKMHSSADSAPSAAGHSGKKGVSGEKETSSKKGTHSGQKGSSGEKEITPVKKELIDALKNPKESSIHCTAEGKNHPLTPAVVEEKATKVKKKAGNFVVTLSSGSQVTCAK